MTASKSCASRARCSESRSTPAFVPSRAVAPGAASRTCHASVLPWGSPSSRRAVSSSACRWTGRAPAPSMNLVSTGKRGPRHPRPTSSSGWSSTSRRSVRPASGPSTTRAPSPSTSLTSQVSATGPSGRPVRPSRSARARPPKTCCLTGVVSRKGYQSTPPPGSCGCQRTGRPTMSGRPRQRAAKSEVDGASVLSSGLPGCVGTNSADEGDPMAPPRKRAHLIPRLLGVTTR